MTTGWDTSESSSQKNFEKAVRLIKGNSDYILNKEAISPDPGEALRKSWNFYGKVVTFTGVVTDSTRRLQATLLPKPSVEIHCWCNAVW